MRRNVLTVRVAEYQNSLPREVVGFSSLETSETCLDVFLCSLPQVILLWHGAVGLDV